MENLWTVILAVLGAYLAVALAIAVLTVIAWWRLFSNAGQAGWKSVVPVLNVYTLYKICWKPVCFWLALLSSAAAAVCGVFIDLEQPQTALALAALALIALSGVLYIVMNFKLAKAFGHGVGFGLGLMLLHTLFVMVLAFGTSRYVHAAGSGEHTA